MVKHISVFESNPIGTSTAEQPFLLNSLNTKGDFSASSKHSHLPQEVRPQAAASWPTIILFGVTANFVQSYFFIFDIVSIVPYTT